MNQKNEKFNKKSNQFNEEFAQPLDEHSVEERERAQRTGDNADYSGYQEGFEQKKSQKRDH
ncbi:hypothetical protein ACFP7A_10725 [Sporolactobacillus kofuensis]|uniref:YfhD family protein n=1 Tax=Sporolactobacillus kofuensis TaxID=269672 RepID=A0ABW1WIA6_9BACL|nr:hypothetical protein [Sporolactobacillus kofuensis]MCO7176350.1 hypothetical protein [Sporolactobacillus kofuensis]